MIVKMVEEEVNTEDLISEVERQPAIWNQACEDYGNNILKRNAWNEVILKFIPDFESKPLTEKKNEIGKFCMQAGYHWCHCRGPTMLTEPAAADNSKLPASVATISRLPLCLPTLAAISSFLPWPASSS